MHKLVVNLAMLRVGLEQPQHSRGLISRQSS